MHPTREIHQEAWDEYLAALSRELLNAPVSIEVASPSGPLMLEAQRLALQALSYDRQDDVFEVAVARGGPRLPSVLRHLVDHPCRVSVDSPTLLAPLTLSVDGDDGARTVIHIEREPDISG